MQQFPPALSHGNLEEVFPDVFFVTGSMETVLNGANWHFSRNMTVVREGYALSLINTIRLDDSALGQLDALGRVANVVRIGSLHGRDDAFYKLRYGATYWAPPGLKHENGVTADKELTPSGETPFSDCRVFVFRTTKLPECILLIDRCGGILVACDSLQNWISPNEFFSEESRMVMTELGFFQPANLGPLWMQINSPEGEDFVRLRDLPFRHALCGHGAPLREVAKEAYADRFNRVFGI